MDLAVPDEPARGHKRVLRDEVAAVVAKQQYPRKRLLPRLSNDYAFLSYGSWFALFLGVTSSI
jgi:hypothetical protein